MGSSGDLPSARSTAAYSPMRSERSCVDMSRPTWAGPELIEAAKNSTSPLVENAGRLAWLRPSVTVCCWPVWKSAMRTWLKKFFPTTV